MAGDPDATSLSLLELLQREPDNQPAWNRFVKSYGHRVYGWCLSYRLQVADAEEMTQQVLLKLVQKLPEFRYDRSKGRFSGWLKTLTNNTISDLFKSFHWQRFEHLATEPAREALHAGLDAEWRKEVLDLACQRVRRQVGDRAWQAFWLKEHDGLSGAEAAKRLGMPLGTYYPTYSRVKKLLQDECRRLGLDDY